MLINGSVYPNGYLKAPPIYDSMNEPAKSNEHIECIYKFVGRPDERIQLFYEDLDMYYPHDIHKFNKIEYEKTFKLFFY